MVYTRLSMFFQKKTKTKTDIGYTKLYVVNADMNDLQLMAKLKQAMFKYVNTTKTQTRKFACIVAKKYQLAV